LAAQHAVVVVSLTGLDEILLQTVPARHAYLAKDVVFGARLADILTPIDGGSLWMIDAAHFDDAQPASLTSVRSTGVPESLPCDK
jgi:inward rectifier potassium channel